MNSNLHKAVTTLAIITVSLIQIQCNYTKHINIRCRPLSDYKSVETVDYRTLAYVVFDSTQYKEYLLSFSDTTDNAAISGVFYVEKCYCFDKGFVLIAEKDSNRYEVIAIADNTRKIIPKRYYKMSIKPYFNTREYTYGSEVRKEIYHKHHVILPAYFLLDEGRICTTDFDSIIAL